MLAFTADNSYLLTSRPLRYKYCYLLSVVVQIHRACNVSLVSIRPFSYLLFYLLPDGFVVLVSSATFRKGLIFVLRLPSFLTSRIAGIETLHRCSCKPPYCITSPFCIAHHGGTDETFGRSRLNYLPVVSTILIFFVKLMSKPLIS